MENTSRQKQFDLNQRTSVFAKDVISMIKRIPINALNENIIKQLLRSATSVGANYREADTAESRKDFIHKIGICKKESNESIYWLDILKTVEDQCIPECTVLIQEAHELTLIFISIVNKTRLEISN